MNRDTFHTDLQCPNCGKVVYYAERILCMNRFWHRSCLRCAKCNRVVDPTKVSTREGIPYCARPCYNNMFFTKGSIIGLCSECACDNERPDPSTPHVLKLSTCFFRDITKTIAMLLK